MALLTGHGNRLFAEFKTRGIDCQNTASEWLHLPGDNEF